MNRHSVIRSFLLITALGPASCSQVDRAWDNPVDPLASNEIRKGAAPVVSPTPNEPPTANVTPTPPPVPRFFFSKFDLPVLTSQFEIKRDTYGSSYAENVFLIKSAFEDAVSFISLERSTNLSQYFWRLNARKYKISENGFSPWSGSAMPVNLFPECNDPAQGNGVTAFRIKAIRDKYDSPGFSSDSLPDNVTHVRIEVDCKSPSLGSYTTTLSKVFRASDFSVDTVATVSPLAADQSIKCIWPEKRLMFDSSGRLYDYRFGLVTSVNANFTSTYGPLYLGAVSECFDVSGKLHIKTTASSNNCFLYDFNENSLVKSGCYAGSSIRSFQPFTVLHKPFEEENWASIGEVVLYNLKIGPHVFKVSSFNKATFDKGEISLYYDNEKIPFEPNIPFGNIVVRPQTEAATIVGREQSFGEKLIALSKDKSTVFLSNPVIDADSIANTRVTQLTIDTPTELTVSSRSVPLSGTCIPTATITATGPIEDGFKAAVCTSNGTYSLTVDLAGSDGVKQITVTDSGLPGRPASATRNFLKDATRPTVTISAPSSPDIRQATNATYTVTFLDSNSLSAISDQQISLVTSGNVSCSKSVTGNNPLYVAISGCSGDGTVGIKVELGAAVDTAGNMSVALTSSNFVNVDNTAPVSLLLDRIGLAADGFLNLSEATSADVVVSYSSFGSSSHSFAVVSSSTTNCGSISAYSFAVPTASSVATLDGQGRKICLRASDAAGNVSYLLSDTIVVDKTPPTMTFSAPNVSPVGSTQTVEFTVSFSDSVSGVSSISLNDSNVILGGSTTGCVATVGGTGISSRKVSVTGCLASNNSITVGLNGGSATDVAGNVKSAVTSGSSFTSYNILPTLTIGSPAANSVTNGSVVLSGTCQQNLPIDIMGDITGTTPYRITCSSAGAYSVSLALSGSDGTKQVTLSSTNATAQTGQVSRSFVKDVTPPSVQINAPNANFVRQTTSVSFDVSFSDLNNISSVDKTKIVPSTSAGVTCNSVVSGTGIGPFSITISGCSGEGTVGVKAEAGTATDTAQNTSLLTNSAVTVPVLREWYQEAYIKAVDGISDDQFGTSIALSGNTLAVGSPYEDASQNTITNGATGGAGVGAIESGSVYVYRRNGDLWTQEAYIKASNVNAFDYFGRRVAVSGDILVVGAPSEDSNQNFITSGSSASLNDSLSESGAVYVFRRTGDQWVQEAYVKASNAGDGDSFGSSLAVSGEVLVVGAPGEDSNQVVVTNGASASANNSASNSGAIYVFRRTSSDWIQEGYIKAVNGIDANLNFGLGFGSEVSISGDTIAVGVPKEASNKNFITNGESASSNASLSHSGAVYLYSRTGILWKQEAYIKAANPTASDRFGVRVSISGNLVVVGSPEEDSDQNSITNGDSANIDNSKTNSGAAYVYRRGASGWYQEAFLKASNSDMEDRFGSSVAVDGNLIAIGAPLEDSNQTYITNGSFGSGNNVLADTGAVYVYRWSASNWIQEAFIKASNADSQDKFGTEVSISGDTVAVSSPFEASDQKVITNGAGASSSNLSSLSGAVYVFRNKSRFFDPTDVQVAKATDNSISVSWRATNLGKAANVVKVVYGTVEPGVSCSSGTVAVSGSGNIAAIPIGENSGTTLFVRVCAGVEGNLSEGTVQRIFIDNIAPSVQSILRGASVNPPTNGSDVLYVVNFTEPVLGLSPANFAFTDVNGTGLTGIIQNISCAKGSSSCSVSVRLGGNAGQLRLDLTNTGGVTDYSGNALQGSRIGDETYTVEGWYQEAFIKASNADVGDQFGSALAMSRDTLVVGSPNEDSSQFVVTNGPTASDNNLSEQSGSAYVYRRVGHQWSQEAYIKASNSGAADFFGSDVSISEDVLVVSSWNEDSNQSAITNGETSSADDSLSASGAVYIYRRNGVTWSQEAYVKASNAGGNDFFGYSVSIDGETLAVGAPGEDSNQNTVTNGPGSSTNNLSSNTGAVYVYVKTNAGWSQQAYIKSATAAVPRSYWDGGDGFGNVVVLSGDTLVVGQPDDDSPQSYITNGVTDATPNGYFWYDNQSFGSVSVFRRQGVRWTQEAYIKPSNPYTSVTGDRFGDRISISGNRIAVGVGNEDSDSTTISTYGVNNDSRTNSGAVYLFKRSGIQWSAEAYIKASNSRADLEFGSSISLSGDSLAVGSVDSSNQSGVLNSVLTSSDTSSPSSGAIYMFKLSSTGWTQEAFVKPVSPDAFDQFGDKVVLVGDTLAVSAPNEDSNQRTITNGSNANPDNTLANSGAVYIFRNKSRYFDPPEVKISFSSVGDATVTWNTANYGKLPSVLKVVYGTSEPAVGCTSGAVAYDGPPTSSGTFSVGTVAGSTYFVRVCAGDSSGLTNGIVQQVFFDNVPPSVLSINRGASVNPTAYSAVVEYIITFSEPVYGLSSSNFSISDVLNTGISGSVSGVYCTAGSVTCIVQVQVGGNAGQLRLDLSSVAGVVDGSGNGLQESFVGNQFYTVKGWYPEAYIKASNSGADDRFGSTVSLSGDVLAVGAPFEDGGQNTIVSGTVVNTDNSSADSGTVYLYQRAGSQWSQVAYVKASNNGSSDGFGNSVAISGNLLAVGAAKEDSSLSTITNGTVNSTDDSLADSGAVYVFRNSNGQWQQDAYIKAANSDVGDAFGYSVSVSGNRLAVGAAYEDSNQTIITNGDAVLENNSASNRGAVYVFRRESQQWVQEAYLKASNLTLYQGGDDLFGYSVALSSDSLVVGEPERDQSESWRNVGAIWRFRRVGNEWSYEGGEQRASNFETYDRYGESVSISGDTVVVGAPGEDSLINTIVHGTSSPTSSNDSTYNRDTGAVYVYRRSASSWSQEAYVKASNVMAGANFGNAVAISGNTLAVGAFLEFSSLNGVINSVEAPYDTSAFHSGAVYLFIRSGSAWSREAYIKPFNSNGGDPQTGGDQFGTSISISGDTLAVGAPFEDSIQSLITNGALSSLDNSSQSSGAVYIFRNRDRMFDPDVIVSSKTSNSITFSWSSNLGTGQFVKVAPATLGTTTPGACTVANTVNVSTGGTSYTYTGLSANTKYGFRLCGADGSNVSQGTLIWDDTLP